MSVKDCSKKTPSEQAQCKCINTVVIFAKARNKYNKDYKIWEEKKKYYDWYFDKYNNIKKLLTDQAHNIPLEHDEEYFTELSGIGRKYPGYSECRKQDCAKKNIRIDGVKYGIENAYDAQGNPRYGECPDTALIGNNSSKKHICKWDKSAINTFMNNWETAMKEENGFYKPDELIKPEQPITPENIQCCSTVLDNINALNRGSVNISDVQTKCSIGSNESLDVKDDVDIDNNKTKKIALIGGGLLVIIIIMMIIYYYM